MQLYLDDMLASLDVDAPRLEAALESAAASGASLELRDGRRRLALTREGALVLLECETSEMMLSLAAADWESAARQAREFLTGKTPTFEALGLDEPRARALTQIVLGDGEHPDCPLCRAARS